MGLRREWNFLGTKKKHIRIKFDCVEGVTSNGKTWKNGNPKKSFSLKSLDICNVQRTALWNLSHGLANRDMLLKSIFSAITYTFLGSRSGFLVSINEEANTYVYMCSITILWYRVILGHRTHAFDPARVFLSTHWWSQHPACQPLRLNH